MPTKELQLPMPIPLRFRRTRWVEEEIDRRFEAAKAQPKEYPFSGVQDNYTYIYKNEHPSESGSEQDSIVSALSVVDELSRERGGPLRILDLGAGFGRFVLNCQEEGHLAHALSAHDYTNQEFKHSEITNQLEEGTFVIGDVHRLADVDGLLDEYDLVVSRNLFQHLTDRLGAMEQTLDKVAENGVALIYPTSLHRKFERLLDFDLFIEPIEDGGFEFMSDARQQMQYDILYARRTQATRPVLFPVEYEHYNFDRDAFYQPHPWRYVWAA